MWVQMLKQLVPIPISKLFIHIAWLSEKPRAGSQKWLEQRERKVAWSEKRLRGLSHGGFLDPAIQRYTRDSYEHLLRQDFTLYFWMA